MFRKSICHIISEDHWLTNFCNEHVECRQAETKPDKNADRF